MNLASGVQQYQQAQQVNPLTLQAKQLELQRLKDTYGASVAQSIAESQRAQTGARVAEAKAPSEISLAQSQASIGLSEADLKKLESLNKVHQTAVNALFPIAQDPKATYEDLVNGMTKTLDSMGASPEAKKNSLSQIPETLKNAPSSKIRLYAAQEATKSLSAQDRFSQIFPAAHFQDVTGGIQPVQGGNVNVTGVEPGTPVGRIIPKTISPGQTNEPTGRTDVNGNPTAYVRDSQGNIIGEKVIPAGTPTTGVTPQMMKTSAVTQPTNVLPSNAPVRIPAGETEDTMKALQGERQLAKTSAQSAAPALNSIDTVLKYLPMAATGKMGESIAGLQSMLGTTGGSKPEELAASARDIIQKSVDDLALQKNAALGGKFAEDLKAAQSTLANAAKNPTAIAKSMQQLQPLIQHSLNYQVGLEKAIGANQSVFAKRQYDNDMIKAYDPLALQMKNAFQSGGKDGLAKFIKENNISESKKAMLIQKLEQYSNLVNKGNINGQ